MTRLLVALVLGLALPASATQIVHSTKAGETIDSIALRYYGTEALGTSLRIHNSLGSSEVGAGSVIEIPVAAEHTLVEGEDWSILAARYWGDWELGPVMAKLVEPPGAPLEPGTQLRIPGLIHHRVQSGENLAKLSRLTYGSPEHAASIGELNGIDDPNRLRVGQHLRLPVLGGPGKGRSKVARKAPKPAPSAPAPPVVVPEPPEVSAPARATRSGEQSQALVDAIEAYYQGEFEEARVALEALRPGLMETGTEPQRRVLFEHLLRVHVAFDDNALACESWAQLTAFGNDTSFDPERLSPKIREVSSGCVTP